jgi:hypothetical protein
MPVRAAEVRGYLHGTVSTAIKEGTLIRTAQP